MRYLLAILPLALILGLLMTGITGCDQSSTPILAAAPRSAAPPLPTTVDGIARWHNRRVEETVRSFRSGAQKVGPTTETLLARWGHLETVDPAQTHKEWQEARRAIENGFRPEELRNLLARSLDRAATDPEIRPRFLEQLRRCLDLLLDEDRATLPAEVNKLAELARSGGTPREKGLAGVLLGSTQRAETYRLFPPDHPLFPVIVGYDEVGTLIGGPVTGALFSSQVEILLFCSLFPGMWP